MALMTIEPAPPWTLSWPALKRLRGRIKNLDALIMCALVAGPDAYVEQSKINSAWCIYYAPNRIWSMSSRDGTWRKEGWPVTASLDAALALCERVLPGWMHDISWWPPSETEPGWTRCTLGGPGYISDETTSDTFEVTLTGDQPKHALALLAAMLRALRAQAASPHPAQTGHLEDPGNPPPTGASAETEGT